VRLWKTELQTLADQTGLAITVTHLPPGTSSRVDDWRGGVSVPTWPWLHAFLSRSSLPA
jgi:hypothetical protein